MVSYLVVSDKLLLSFHYLLTFSYLSHIWTKKMWVPKQRQSLSLYTMHVQLREGEGDLIKHNQMRPQKRSKLCRCCTCCIKLITSTSTYTHINNQGVERLQVRQRETSSVRPRWWLWHVSFKQAAQKWAANLQPPGRFVWEWMLDSG